MPVISFEGREAVCAVGTNLRAALLDAGMTPHHGLVTMANCHGFGTCGTCAVEVRGPVTEKTAMERWRLSFPPHREERGLRLACQCRVVGDVQVVKHPGVWGQHRELPDDSTETGSLPS